MGIFNLFKGKKQKNDETNVASQKDVRKGMSLAECVELMFRNAGIRPHVDGNKYLTEVQARHCVFTPVLVAEGNRLIIMVRFPAPVPEQFAYSVNYEVERINGMYRDAEVTLSHNDDGDFTIYSMIIKEYDSVSAETADEIRRLMVHAVDVLDEDNFRSLLCSLIGHRDYSELEARMIEGNTAGGGEVRAQIPGGYAPLLKESGDISCPRFLGRLLVYATDIIEKKISKEVASDLLTRQTPFDEIVQRAYNVADENERDLLRKLRYLGKAKATDHDDDDNDFMIGRLEALDMVQGNPWTLLSGDGHDDC